MASRLKLKPLAAALAALRTSAAPRTEAVPPRRALLPLIPLGALLTGFALAPSAGFAQSTPSAPAAGTPETTLPTVNVKDAREAEEKGYQGTTSNVGKLQQLPRDIPQSLTIITEPLMHDRNADTFKEALRNVAGLTYSAGEGGRIGDNITLRGFTVYGDLYLDGMRDIAQYNREMFNLEQIDVLRGSASMLFGRGSAGGIINQVSKQASPYDSFKAGYTLGSNDYNRFTADVNKGLGPDAGVRVAVMKTDTDSFRTGVHQSRWGFAPSVRFGIGGANEFAFSLYRTQDDNVPDYGVPYFQNKPLSVPVERFYGIANADFERYNTTVLTGSWLHRFEDGSTLKSVLRQGKYQRDLWAVAPRLAAGATVITDSSVLTRQRQARGGDERPLTSQTDFTTKFQTGPVKHLVLAGMELAKENTARWTYPAGVANPNTTVGNTNPWVILPAGYQNTNRQNDTTFRALTRGFYAQDFMELTPKWKLLLGARHDNFSVDIDNPTGADFNRTDNVWSYRGGLIYQPNDQASYYVSYGTSFNPSGDLYSLDAPGSNTPPEKNRNYEIGAKWDLLDGDLSLRTALFRTEKTNERNTDLTNPTVYLLSGKRHTQGIEFEGAGRITKRWEMFGALAISRARIDVPATTATAAATIATTAQNVGLWPQYTGPYTANLWSTYRIGDAWKAGGGIEFMSKRYASTDNSIRVPSYRRVDAMVSYDMKNSTIKLNVLNLLDKDYYESVYQGHVIPGATRTVQLSYEVKFN